MARQYGKIETTVWQRPKFSALSDDAKMAWLYLISCPHGNAIGAFSLPVGYAATDLKWPFERVSKTLDELVSNQFIDRSETVDLIVIRDWWGHNTIENPNVAKAAMVTFKSLPNDKIIGAVPDN